MNFSPKPHNWGAAPWQIDFTSARERALPDVLDFAVIGGGFTGLAAAAWLRKIAPNKSVAVFEIWKVGAGASGRTGGMALSESAAGDLPSLGDVLAGFKEILGEFGVDCDQRFTGAWEIGRGKALANSAISWNDSGTLRVTKEVEGGTIDPGKLVSSLARAADRLGAFVLENHPVTNNRGDTTRVGFAKNLSAQNYFCDQRSFLGIIRLGAGHASETDACSRYRARY
jgi:hypothetical protein